jgi:hypothetical protein
VAHASMLMFDQCCMVLVFHCLQKSLLEGEVMGGGGGGNVPLGAVLELLARLSAGSPSPPLHNAGS